MPRNITASNIGNGVISLLWQLRCHCIPDHDKFSSLSNKTVVAIFQMFVYGDVVMLRIGRYWPWKTVTVSSHLHKPVRPLLLHRMAFVSFRLYVSEKFGQLARIFWANGLPPPLAKDFPYAYAYSWPLSFFTVSVTWLSRRRTSLLDEHLMPVRKIVRLKGVDSEYNILTTYLKIS